MANTTNHLRGEENPSWRGDEAGYSALHFWVRRHKEKPADCQHCGTTNKPLDWANISRTYKRDLDDWMALCKKCHRTYDRALKCRNGHDRTAENTYLDSRGIKKCRTCKIQGARRRYYARQGREVPA